MHSSESLSFPSVTSAGSGDFAPQRPHGRLFGVLSFEDTAYCTSLVAVVLPCSVRPLHLLQENLPKSLLLWLPVARNVPTPTYLKTPVKPYSAHAPFTLQTHPDVTCRQDTSKPCIKTLFCTGAQDYLFLAV